MTAGATKALVILVTVILIAFDIILAVDRREGNTYSEVIREWFWRFEPLYYAVAFGMGVLMGHWGAK